MEDAPLCGPRLLSDEELHEALTAIPLEDVRQRVRDHIQALLDLIVLFQRPALVSHRWPPASAGCHEELPLDPPPTCTEG